MDEGDRILQSTKESLVLDKSTSDRATMAQELGVMEQPAAAGSTDGAIAEYKRVFKACVALASKMERQETTGRKVMARLRATNHAMVPDLQSVLRVFQEALEALQTTTAGNLTDEEFVTTPSEKQVELVRALQDSWNSSTQHLACFVTKLESVDA
eukprot:4204197-Amphidinium_carterae.2